MAKKNVVSGFAVKEARAIYTGRQKRKRLNESLPEAWNRIVTDPDSLLLDLIAETAERIWGFKPDIDDVRNFVKSNETNFFTSPEPTAASSSASTPQVNHPSNPPPMELTRTGKRKGGRPTKMKIEEETFELRFGFEILVNTANWLIRRGKIERKDCPIAVSRGERNLVNLIPEHKSNDDFTAPKKLSNGFWIETHSSSKATIKYAKRLLEMYGISENLLHVE